MWSPNPRLQRTHLRAPLSRKTFAAIPRSASLKRSAACGVAFLPVLAVVMGCLRPVVDYSFRAEGVVTDPGGRPIPNARVTLEISRTVYKVITPVTKSDTYTDENGRFAFGYISHDADPPYTLGFEKLGYQSVLLEGEVQAMNPHSVTLKPVAK